jgi:hypothetical protein
MIEELNKMKISNADAIDEPPKADDDPRVKLFEVKNPVKLSGHISYSVSGLDSEGPFEQLRRFSEFFALKNVLT